MTEASPRTFGVTLTCTNCLNQWDIDVPYGAEVGSSYDGVWIHSCPAGCKGLRPPCKGYRPECPVCGRDDKSLRTPPIAPPAAAEGRADA